MNFAIIFLLTLVAESIYWLFFSSWLGSKQPASVRVKLQYLLGIYALYIGVVSLKHWN